jgi:lipid-binding SYLF domain-containing protein
MKRVILTLALILALPVPAVAASRAEQQAQIQHMRADTLAKLYKAQPGAEGEIRSAYGYSVFSSANLTAFFLTAAYGYGIAHDNRAGGDTYMQMASGGVGLGLGAKDFRVVFIFANKDAYNNFIYQGLDLSGQADAAAKAGAKGGAVSGAEDISPGVRVYQMTETGLALQLTLQGTKYWKDSYLNGGPENVAHHQSSNGGGSND